MGRRPDRPPSSPFTAPERELIRREMLVLHGLAGLCIVVGAFRQRETEFRVESANAFLAVLIPMAVLVLVLPNFVVLAPGPFYTPLQLAFVSAACLGLYTAFLFIQISWHRAYTKSR
jgi:Ca2+:H+ antiporter